VTASTDGKVRIVDLEAGKVLSEFEAAENNPNKRWRAAFSADGGTVAALSEKAWGLFDARTGKLHKDLESRRPDKGEKDQVAPAFQRAAFVQCLAVSADGRLAAAGTNWSLLRVWDAKTGKVLRGLASAGHTFWGIAFSPDGRFLATAGDRERTVRLWRVADGAELTSFSGHEADVYSVAFAPDGRSIYSGAADCTILRWDMTRWVAAAAKIPEPEGGKGK
jgi:WD40 repeat protein